MKKKPLASERLTDLLYEALETEIGGVDIYHTALRCVQNQDLKKEWEHYLEQTADHVEVMREVCEAFELDPDRDTPGRQIVRHIGESLVVAMEMALESSSPEAAQLVAAECVVLAETKDHMNWSLIGKVIQELDGRPKDQLNAHEQLADAHEEVEVEEDEHLYHTTGWTRELWLESLGLTATIPPPEEVEDARSAEEVVQVKKKSAYSGGD